MKSYNLNYISRLDHLRFFAATLVIFHHFHGNLIMYPHHQISNLITLWLINGSSGVSFFLVLTGFLFCLIVKGGDKSIRYTGFIYNRILRIFPLLIFLVMIVICCGRQQSSPLDILRILTLQLNTGNPITGWGHNFYPSGPIWTIAVEFQFYLIFPLLVTFLKKYHVKYLISLILLMIFVKANIAVLKGGGIYWNLYHTLIGRLDQFLIGIIFGFFYQKGYFKFLSQWKYQFIFLFLSLFILTLLFRLSKMTLLYCSLSFTIEAICWGTIALCYLTIKLPNIFIINKILSYLGMMSFSMYLFHLPIGIMINQIFHLNGPDVLSVSIIQSCIRLPIIIFFSACTFFIIEKPFMELRVKYTK